MKSFNRKLLINKLSLAAGIFLSVATLHANAALYNRGNGMIYDSTLNITWLQDANYAKTSGASPTWYTYIDNLPVNDGRMELSTAQLWAYDLVYGGYSDWRFASAKPLSSNCCIPPATYDGSTDLGYNITRGEIGHLFAELGNLARYDTAGNPQSGYGFINTSFVDAGTGQTVSFLNVQSAPYSSYWEIGGGPPCHIEGCQFEFETWSGAQDWVAEYRRLNFVWLVRDGDVSAVPVPAAAWLFGSALVGLATTRRRRKS
jgi:hypothetical protein